jgi:hypothetical protein
MGRMNKKKEEGKREPLYLEAYKKKKERNEKREGHKHI